MANRFDATRELAEKAAKEILEESESVGLKTGFDDLDRLMGGFEPGELILCCGRPAMGKTGFAISLINNLCIRGDKTCVYFSLEKSAVCFMKHLIKTVALVYDTDPRMFSPEDREIISEISKAVAGSGLIVESAKTTIEEIIETCTGYEESEKPDLIIIDFLQLIDSEEKESTGADYDYYVRRLRDLALTIQRPVLVLSQIGRAVERRRNHMPMLKDLREYGKLDMYADKIIFLYRDEYYDYDTEKKGLATIIIAKNYNGEVGTIELVHLMRGFLVAKG